MQFHFVYVSSLNGAAVFSVGVFPFIFFFFSKEKNSLTSFRATTKKREERDLIIGCVRASKTIHTRHNRPMIGAIESVREIEKNKEELNKLKRR